tara:strand:+ start:50 stop:655 length:606 start_codon:yes stop_codon:yes gene_type:complete
MKIAITGHSRGIGKSFAEQLSKRGHEIIGISRRDNNDIQNISNTATLIEPADLFINNAQSNYAQTELLYEVWKRWANWLPPRHKWIWNISTMIAEEPIDTSKHYFPDLVNSARDRTEIEKSQYRNQKLALEEASRQLRYKSNWPRISIIRPGGVATQTGKDDTSRSNVDEWVKSVIDTFTHNSTIHINEISIGYTNTRIPV